MDRSSFDFPRLALVGQRFSDAAIPDIEAAVHQEVRRIRPSSTIRPGQSVAITAGSRGIRNMDRVLACLCALFKELGAQPFLFPSMGSHGGATAEGQKALLGSLGITEETMGAPIRSSMDTALLGETPDGVPVYADALAMRADHIVIVNRIKSHTKFKAPIESGLHKMMGIGMGKHRGAEILHQMAVEQGIHKVIMDAARMVLARCPILLGLGLVENAYGQTHTIRALPPAEMEQGEEELLRLAKELSPSLPFPDIDLLVVDAMGKDISGTGMDTNVTGRNRDILGDFCTEPRVRRLAVLDLTQASGGNALGVGFADFTTDRLVAAMDYRKTVTNALTGVSPEKAAIPVHFPTDRETLQAALDSLGRWSPETTRVVRIRNTLRLDRMLVSKALLPQLPGRCSILREPEAMRFNESGDLLPLPDA